MVEIDGGAVDRVYDQGYDTAKEEDKRELATDAQYAIYRQQEEEKFNIYRLKSDDWIEKIAREFAGEVPEIVKGEGGDPVPTGRWVKDKNKIASVNSAGAQIIKNSYLNYANKGTYLSKLDFPFIKSVCNNMNVSLSKIFIPYHRKYGIPRHLCRMIISNIVNKIYIEMTRAIGGREADLISKSYNFVQHESYNVPTPGMFGKLKGWMSPRR